MIGQASEPLAAMLLAQRVVEDIRSAFNTGPGTNEVLVYVLVVIGLIALFFTGRHCFKRKEAPPEDTRPDYLSEAATLLGLSRAERDDLARLAARARLAEPASMLLSPANLAHAFARAFSEASDADLQVRLAALSTKLFGTAPAE